MQLSIRVQPKANRNAIEVDGEKVTVRVTAAPEGGKTDHAVVELLSKRLGLAKRRVSIVRGQKARDKTIQIDDLTQKEALAKLRLTK